MNFTWFKKILLRDREIVQKAIPFEEPANNYYRPLQVNSLPGTRIWAVGGGKGGVGKSLVSANLGIILSKLGKRVLLVDADLGAANLHTFLGTEGSKSSISNFFKDEVPDIRQLIVKTPIPNLDLISGGKDSLDAADSHIVSIPRLRESLRRSGYDDVVLDIGPGTASSLLDMFLMSKEGIILTTPEPTTIENNYRFMKCLFLRRIKTLAESNYDGKLKELLQKILSDQNTPRVKTISDIISQLTRLDFEQGRLLKENINNINISMIMNQTRKKEDQDLGSAIKKACSDYFGIEISFLGSISHEECVVDSIRLRKPLLVHFSYTGAARAIEECLNQAINRTKSKGLTKTNIST